MTPGNPPPLITWRCFSCLRASPKQNSFPSIWKRHACPECSLPKAQGRAWVQRAKLCWECDFPHTAAHGGCLPPRYRQLIVPIFTPVSGYQSPRIPAFPRSAARPGAPLWCLPLKLFSYSTVRSPRLLPQNLQDDGEWMDAAERSAQARAGGGGSPMDDEDDDDQATAIVLAEDKKYYPSAEAGHSTNTAGTFSRLSLKPLELPLIIPEGHSNNT
jgi:hypothetical protein